MECARSKKRCCLDPQHCQQDFILWETAFFHSQFFPSLSRPITRWWYSRLLESTNEIEDTRSPSFATCGCVLVPQSSSAFPARDWRYDESGSPGRSAQLHLGRQIAQPTLRSEQLIKTCIFCVKSRYVIDTSFPTTVHFTLSKKTEGNSCEKCTFSMKCYFLFTI